MEERATTRTQKRAETDEKILIAAARVFGEKGYANALLTDIASAAGVSQGLVSQRFVSKENLLLEVFDMMAMRVDFTEAQMHMPDTMYVLLDRLKLEVVKDPVRFAFIKTVHNSLDAPESCVNMRKAVFDDSPVPEAIAEAQRMGDLPQGDPWDIFQVFLSNASSLIDWYHRFALPMPDNDTFLKAIQYSRREKEQQREINSLHTEHEILYTAIANIYPLMVFCNLTKNTYRKIRYDDFTVRRAGEEGQYDSLIEAGAAGIPNEVQRQQFVELMGRENALAAYDIGRHDVSLRHVQTGDDGAERWVESRLIINRCCCGDCFGIILARGIDDEIKSIQRFDEALAEAEDAMNAKSRFLGNLSHDIRTPMNIITGFTGIAERNADKPDKVRDCMRKMRESEEQLMTMLEEALELAAKDDMYSVHEEVVSIDDRTSMIMEYARKLAEQKGVSLEYDLTRPDTPRIYADILHVDKTLKYLISNAVHFTAPGGKVRITVRQLESRDEFVRCEVIIDDTGVGMSPEFLSHIFEPFEKESSSTVSGSPGFGLSMALVKRYLDEIGGSIEISSEVGKGTTVRCEFRFRRA